MCMPGGACAGGRAVVEGLSSWWPAERASMEEKGVYGLAIAEPTDKTSSEAFSIWLLGR